MREKNRAASVAMNAEIRRTKARLLEDAQKLQKLALKKVLFLLKKIYLVSSRLFFYEIDETRIGWRLFFFIKKIWLCHQLMKNCNSFII